MAAAALQRQCTNAIHRNRPITICCGVARSQEQLSRPLPQKQRAKHFLICFRQFSIPRSVRERNFKADHLFRLWKSLKAKFKAPKPLNMKTFVYGVSRPNPLRLEIKRKRRYKTKRFQLWHRLKAGFKAPKHFDLWNV